MGSGGIDDRSAGRQRTFVLLGVGLLWAGWRAGLGADIINTRGWPNLAEFWTASLRPELDSEFVRLTIDAAISTLALAVLGTVASLVIGAVGALATSQLLWGTHAIRSVSQALLVVPRAIHEVIWALLLVQVFGFDPMVAVLAIAIPFGAVTAKVYADAIDTSDRAGFDQLRATGAGRMTALFYGVLPTARHDLVSYGFYRMECAVRSAAVLGIVGVGGLGFQLDLSFETLRYNEIWTLIAGLMILSGLIDRWSTVIRRSNERTVSQLSLAAIALLVPVSIWWSGLNPSVLWSERSRRLAGELIAELISPRLGPGGWSQLFRASVDTAALSILALVISAVGGFAVALIARRRTETLAPRSIRAEGTGFITRVGLLLARSVPAPIWAFLAVLVFFPGLWPGAIGLAIYNLGVLGRLFAEAIEESDTTPTDQLLATGSGPLTALLYGSVPSVAPRLLALSLYRWEVIVRETVVVGVVGAGGLGQLLNDHIVARDFAAVTGVILVLTLAAIAVDALGNQLRQQIR